MTSVTRKISQKANMLFYKEARREATNVVKELKGADRLFSRKKVLRDDSLERRDGTADEQENNSKNGTLNLPITTTRLDNITKAHQHGSKNYGDQREVD